ncbi:MAG: hypothetical protein ACJAZS_000841 [Alteromonas naphthalenivorans]|jgi:hypothetical protein
MQKALFLSLLFLSLGSFVSMQAAGAIDTQEEKVECSVCLENLSSKKTVTLSKDDINCGHVFHMDCLDRAVQEVKECPLCRRVVADSELKLLGIYLRTGSKVTFFRAGGDSTNSPAENQSALIRRLSESSRASVEPVNRITTL